MRTEEKTISKDKLEVEEEEDKIKTFMTTEIEVKEIVSKLTLSKIREVRATRTTINSIEMVALILSKEGAEEEIASLRDQVITTKMRTEEYPIQDKRIR
jgi:hypothetical protein